MLEQGRLSVNPVVQSLSAYLDKVDRFVVEVRTLRVVSTCRPCSCTARRSSARYRDLYSRNLGISVPIPSAIGG